MTPIKATGNLTLGFSEKLKVPTYVQNLLEKRNQRILSEESQKSSSVNASLDAYILEVFNMSCMQYFQETESFRSNKIGFTPHLILWTEE